MAVGDTTQGRRVDDGTKRWDYKPGDYGRVKRDGEWVWAVLPTNTDLTSAGDIPQHEVTEHEDGTITVSPSILLDAGDLGQWHGYLERGVWREV